MTMRTMWAVSAGDYSDYRVLCICETKEAAEIVAAKYNQHLGSRYGVADVEEFALVDGSVQRESILYMQQVILDDGTTQDLQETIKAEWPFERLHEEQEATWRWIRAPYIQRIGGRLEVQGKDHERVRRIFGEQKAALMADDAYRAQREMRGGK